MQTNRRDFLQLSLSCTALAATGVPAFASTAAAGLPVHRFVYDNRYAAVAALAARMAASADNAHLYAMQGDITALWYNTLQQLWQRQPCALMGVTEAGPLFCLEQLAPLYGLRVVGKTFFAASNHGVAQVDNPAMAPIVGREPLVTQSPLFAWLIAPRTDLQQLTTLAGKTLAWKGVANV